MSDQNLIAFGCGVAFIALAGVYVFVRSRFEVTVLAAPIGPLAAAPK